MTVHKLTVGDGYTYLTRQVAGGDVQRQAGQSAADYYTQGGNPPGRWAGSGVAALGLEAGQQVHEAQMRNLFGEGLHPDAEARQDAYLDANLAPHLSKTERSRVHAAAERAGKLGQKFPAYKTLDPFGERVAKRLGDIESETGREPTGAEVAKVKREESHRQRAGVAGYDLVFTPVKSVSVLWSLHPDEQVRTEVKAAHDAAVTAVVALLEEHAAFTRAGVGGVAQIETIGLVATAFDHYDSRSGDPDLHTHLAVANKVQGTDGKWRSLDGSALYAIGVAASETYNSTIEAELTTRLGVTFTERPGPARNGRPVREIDGIDSAVLKHFSARRSIIETRYAELRADFRTRHGRDPDPNTARELAQQAALETREGKDRPRPLAVARQEWTAQAVARFGPGAIDQVAATVPIASRPDAVAALTPEEVAQVAARVLQEVSAERATWTRWNVHAETMRRLRTDFTFTNPDAQRAAADSIVSHALGEGRSINLAVAAPVEAPAMLRRSDGVSVFVRHESARYTSQSVLDAEARLVKAAQTPTVYSTSADSVAERIAAFESRTGRVLDEGQRELVTAFAADDRLLAVGIGPAGSGKTTAMRAYREVLAAEGRRLVGLAPSAQAAKVLEADLGVTCSTVDKLLWSVCPGNLLSGPELAASLRHLASDPASLVPGHDLKPGDVLLVDEASMAGTFNLDRLTALADVAGVQVRLLGDDCQLGAVASGGALRLIAAEAGATELRDLHRFQDPAFAQASLKLREGDAAGLDYFQERGRLKGGSRDAMLEAVYTGWKRDTLAGKTSLMMAHSNTIVIELSDRARADRIAAGEVKADGVALHNGSTAGRGDWVVTRQNEHRLKYNGGKDFIRNGQAWTVTKAYADGSLKVKSRDSRGTTILPAEYVAEHVELAYAATVHRCQGMTVDTAHPLLTTDLTRDALYVAATRAAETTTLYAVTHTEVPADPDHRLDRPKWDPDATAAREIAEQILAKEPDSRAATNEREHQRELAASLATLVPMYRTATERGAEHHYESLIDRVGGAHLHDTDLADIKANGLGALAGTLAKAEAAGWNPEQILTLAITRGGVDDADSVTAVLVSRINTHMDDHTPPPTGAMPTEADLHRYRDLLRPYYPDANLDPDTALTPAPVNAPINASHPAATERPADRYKTELTNILGAQPVEAVAAERAWPAVVGALRRAEAVGQYSADALLRATAQRDFDGLDSIAPNLAWRIERQTRLLELDPTHTGQAWPALAWTTKAWEAAGGNAAELIDGLAHDRALADLALEAGHQLTWHQRTQAIETAPHPLSWAGIPRSLHDSDAVPVELRDFLDRTADAITTRVDHLADQAVTDRPAWTEAFGDAPHDDEAAFERWRAAIALAAAHRDTHQVQLDDPAHPFGPYLETGRAGHHAWWAAASAALAIDNPDAPAVPTGLADTVDQQLAHAIARDLYQALPETERETVHQALADRLGSAWHLIAEHPEATVVHPAVSNDLRLALYECGMLSPSAATELQLTARHLRESTDAEEAAPAQLDAFAVRTFQESHGIAPGKGTVRPL
ncbi:MobF family relaxase [Glycomyces harbinensis]|uniref:Conjugative relaxase domain-containing protein, TrwC/TraI family n=1 Tax=Glycomyces harbinensis TaxID=58114 RepID=A0A1G6YDG4_9ACTN|nr:MobF family relaxase [Glycomyces harbinensis]SDD87626.1 conjugative relaxase domain-containing protein, TrwC/TraI family [Glycomyces harbinensis]